MKPFIKYPGGKAKELPIINRYKPQIIERYFEPFVGGGSVFFDLNIQQSYINDKSEDLYLLYVFAKEQNAQLEAFLQLLNHNWILLETNNDLDFENLGFSAELFNSYYEQSQIRKTSLVNKMQKEGKQITEENIDLLKLTAKKTAFYMCVRTLYNTPNIQNYFRVGAFVFLREYCYSSMFRFNDKGEFNVPYGGISYNKKYLTNKIENIFNNEVEQYFQFTNIYNEDFEAFFSHFNFNQNDFIFLDPPYDSEFSTYDKNTFIRNDQIRLRDSLINLNAKWMLIIKNTDFIHDLYNNFNIYEYDKKYMVSFKNRNDKQVKHLLITNYDIG